MHTAERLAGFGVCVSQGLLKLEKEAYIVQRIIHC